MATVDIRRDKDGKILGYRFRACIGLDDGKRKVWRTESRPRANKYIKRKAVSNTELKNAQDAANIWEKEKREEFRKSHGRREDLKDITFKDFVNHHWLPDHVNDGRHALNTVAFFESSCKSSLEYFNNQVLSEIDTEMTKRYLNELSSMKYVVKRKDKTGRTVEEVKEYSTTSQMHHFGTFRNIMQYAYRLGYISEDPCQRISEKESPKRAKKPIDFLNPGEAQRFLAAADKEFEDAKNAYAEKPENVGTVVKAEMWRVYMYLLITTGLRRGEAVALQWGDIDANNLTVSITKSICSDKSSPTKMKIKETKTGETRKVALLPVVNQMLDSYKTTLLNYFDLEDISPSDYVFASETSLAVPIYCSTPTRYVSKFVKRNGLPDVSPHDLRHTAASLALESGAGIKEISELMGHSDIGTTSKFYAALTQEAKRRTVEGIGSVLFSNKEKAKEGE